jgi:N-lysine methyltransferase SETD6
MDEDAKFFQWMHDSGYKVHPSLYIEHSESMGRRVMTRDEIKQGTVLFSIPRKKILNWKTCELPNGAKLSQWVQIILSFMFERSKGDASAWKPYFDIVPTQLDTPVFWDDESLKDLHHTTAYSQLGLSDIKKMYKEEILPYVEANADLFRPEWTSFDAFKLLGSIVMAYSFSSNSLISLVPFADTLNHVTGKNNARLYFKKQVLQMRAIKTIPPHQELINTYGDLSNSSLLRKYGFVDDPNPFDDVRLPFDLLQSALPSASSRLRQLLVCRDPTADFDISRDYDDGLVKIVSAAVGSPSEFELFVRSGTAPEPTREALEVIFQIVDARLAQLQTPPPHPRGEVLSDRQRKWRDLAAALRRSEASVLLSFRASLSDIDT